MRINFPKERLLPAAFAVGMLALGSCTNNDYDLNGVDMTMGFGGDELTIPSSSTNEIKLSEVLELEEDGSVKLDADSNYVFQLAGNDVTAAHPNVAPVTLEAKELASQTFVFSAGSNAKSHRIARVGDSYDIDKELDPQEMIRYDGNSKEVKELLSAEVASAKLTVALDFSGLKSGISTISVLKMMLPGFLDISKSDVTVSQSGVNYDVALEDEGMGVTLNNVPTSSNLTLTINVKKLNFEGKRANSRFGKLTINETTHDINLKGYFNMALKANFNITSATVSELSITAKVCSDAMTIKKATGEFDPDINIDLGKMEVTGVPDFLTDGSVVVDLANPQIRLSVANDMEVAALIAGKYNGVTTQAEAYKNGQIIATVNLPGMEIKKASEAATTKLCICRTSEGVGPEYEPKTVPTLSDLIRTIPDSICIRNINARANLDETATFEFGHTYNVQPNYEVYAPIAFAEDAQIVYKDSADGWNDDLKDLKLSDEAYVEMTANVKSCVPIYLNIKAEPVDVNGNVISDKKLKVEIPNGINASTDGKTPATTAISIKISQHEDDALKLLNGLRFTITGAAKKEGQTTVVGKTLNARDHTLKLSDIKIKIKGKVIGDFN